MKWIRSIMLALATIPGVQAMAQVTGQGAGQDVSIDVGVETDSEQIRRVDGLPVKLPPADAIAPLVPAGTIAAAEELKARAEVRDYRRQLRDIRFRYFNGTRHVERRRRGIEQLREFTDPASFPVMYEVLREEDDVVLKAMLDHFELQGDWGQAALAWIVLQEKENEALSYEALTRLRKPAPDQVVSLIDQALRSKNDFRANFAGRLAGHLDLHETIPLLIHGQADGRPIQEPGDDGWILVGRQRVFVRALIPVVGDNSGAFIPVPGVLTDGVILRVVEAVAVIYRSQIHNALVSMTTSDSGQSTAHLGYDKEAWRQWYETTYIPQKLEQARLEAIEQHEPERPEKRDAHNRRGDAGARGTSDTP